MEFGRNEWKTYEQGINKEWLLSNGIGGFCSSTVIGANTRRYHGLLIASFKPPVQRHLILSSLLESVQFGEHTDYLSSYRTGNFTSSGFLYQQRFTLDPLPHFIYNIGELFLEKSICMVYGENKVIINYKFINNGEREFTFRVNPLINFRDYHGDSKRSFMTFNQTYKNQQLEIQPQNSGMTIGIKFENSDYTKFNDCWFMNMEYETEKERGLSSHEDHFMPGVFEAQVLPYRETHLALVAAIWTSDKKRELPGIALTEGLINLETQRISALREKLVVKSGDLANDPCEQKKLLEFAGALVEAADKFIVKRDSTGALTILAGFPWFTDWGRDAMIALPGLTLSTGRFEDCREIMRTFAKYTRHGLVPNVFADGDDEPAYNTVDAALWFFEAAGKYAQYTEDYEFIRKVLYPVLTEILEAYENGTLFDIRMDKDHLITAGNAETQLTWMDAKVDNWVVTPRHGKAVEINALWYNALKIMEDFSVRLGGDLSKNAARYAELADKVKLSFTDAFWNEEKNCLYDVITDSVKDGSIRPNQIFAVSLLHPVIEGGKAEKIVELVWNKLYATYGLRSLSGDDKSYRGVYSGDRYSRDGAYHQGTVWAWPIGHFITAFRRVKNYSAQSRETAIRLLEPFMDHMNDAGIGNVSEIFDGDSPNRPRGCFAQAWSVAEILRTLCEDILNH